MFKTFFQAAKIYKETVKEVEKKPIKPMNVDRFYRECLPDFTLAIGVQTKKCATSLMACLNTDSPNLLSYIVTTASDNQIANIATFGRLTQWLYNDRRPVFVVVNGVLVRSKEKPSKLAVGLLTGVPKNEDAKS